MKKIFIVICALLIISCGKPTKFVSVYHSFGGERFEEIDKYWREQFYLYFYGRKPDVSLDPNSPPYVVEEVPKPETFHGVPVDILDRLIQSESSWRYNVVNKAEDSRGLAQVNMKYFPYFRKVYGIKDPMNPWQSLCFAADYLSDLYLATGSWYEACLGYKCGLDGRADAPEWKKELCHWIAEGGER